MRLVAASSLGAVELEEASGQRARLVHAADEEQGLAQLGEHERMEDHAASGGHALQRLVQEREGLRSASGQGIRRTQEGGGHGEITWDVGGLRERQAPFECGDRLVEVPLTAGEQPHPEKRSGNIEGRLGHLGHPHRLFCHAPPLGEALQFGQTPGHIATGGHGG